MTDRYVKLSASSNAGTGGTPSTYLGGRSGILTAWNQSGPGDNILLLQPDNGGDIYVNYSLKLIGRSGAAGNPITIKPAPGHKITITSNRNWPTTDYKAVNWTEQWWVEGHYITIEDIHWTKSNANGLRVNPDGRKVGRSSNITVRNCSGTHHLGVGMAAKYSDNVLFDNVYVAYNDCTSNKNPAWGYADHQAALAVEYIDGLEIKNSVIHDNAGEGVLVDGTSWIDGHYSRNVSIHDNTISNNPEVNLYIHGLDGNEDKLIYNNLIYNTPDAVYAGPISGWKLPAYNHIINIWLSTIEIWTFKHDSNCVGNKIFNNILSAGSGVVYVRAGYGPDPGPDFSQGHHKNNDVFNNLFLRCGSSFAVWATLNNTSGNRIKNNIIVVGNGQTVVDGKLYGSNFSDIGNNCFYIESGGSGPPSWMRGTGDVFANPRLENINASLATRLSMNPANYALDTTYPSPCINAGWTSPYPTDYYGNSRAGAFDIGPIESGSGGSPPPIPKTLDAAWTNPDESSGVIVLAEGGSTVFTDATIAQGGATVESRDWSFPGGNPTSSTASSVEVTYDLAGVYSVTLEVEDITNGVSDTLQKTQYVYVAEPPPESTDVAYKIVQFNAGDVTIPMTFEPKAMLFVIGNCTSSEGIEDGMSISVGKATSASEHTQSNTLQKDAVSSEGGYRRSTSSGVVQVHTAENTVKFSGVVTGKSSSAITMSWTGDTSDAEVGYVVCIGGDAVQTAKVATLNNLNAVGDTQAVSGDFNVAIVLSTLAVGSWEPGFSYGFAVEGDESVCATSYGTNWGTPGTVSTQVRNDAVACLPTNSANVGITFGSTSTVFELLTDKLNVNSANDGVHVMLLNTGLLKAACGIVDLPTSTTEAQVACGFDPGIVLLGATNLAAGDSDNTEYDATSKAGPLLLYGATANEQFSYGYGIEYSASPENAFTYTSEDFVQRDGDQTVRSDVTGAATGILPGDGEFTIKLDPAGGGKSVWLAIEGVQEAPPPATDEEDNISKVGTIAGLRPGAI